MTVELTAYEIHPPGADGWTITPADTRRGWMDQTREKTANRCLPLTMANQAGWFIKCPVQFKATWGGKTEPESTRLEFPDQNSKFITQIRHNFGSGIISFVIPWLFRTSDGYGLFVRGPTNYFRPNVVPLDGLVETDWAPFTFTMNWKITTPDTEVWFRKGDPICMILPYPMNLLEQVDPRMKSIHSNPILKEDMVTWMKSRMQVQESYKKGQGSAWLLDYMRGRKSDGTRAPEHKTTLKVVKFQDNRSDD